MSDSNPNPSLEPLSASVAAPGPETTSVKENVEIANLNVLLPLMEPFDKTEDKVKPSTSFGEMNILTEEIKKPGQNLQKRNYRQTHGVGDEDESNPSPSTEEETQHVVDNDHINGIKEDSELPLSADTSQEVPDQEECLCGLDRIIARSVILGASMAMEAEDGIASNSDSDGNNLSSLFNFPDVLVESSPPVNPRSRHSSIVELSSEDSDSDFDDDPSNRLHSVPLYPGGVEMEDELAVLSDSSDDSSSDLQFQDDGLEDDDSSDSSDSVLEDLVEQTPEPVRSSTPTINGATGAETIIEEATGNSTETKESSSSTPKKRKVEPKKKQELPPVLLKPKPKSAWNGPQEIFKREFGYRGKVQSQSAEIFRSKFYGSLFSVERLELMKKLDGHNGCVNCLHFNYSGTKLASGSDDLQIKIWNYGIGQLLTSFSSGHRANVFQAKFLPLIGLDNMIVSCARDCQVRLTELNSSGSIASSRKLAQHRGAAHKMTVSYDTPQVVMSCGEDGVVYSIDIREDKPQMLVNLRDIKGKKVPLYSITGNPLSSHEFCITGRDEYVRIYDARKLSTSSVTVSQSGEASSDPPERNERKLTPLKKFCPHHLQDSRNKPHVTAGVYNYNGKEILGSYNDENIYLFDATHSDMADCIKVYEGHRNSATVKGVNFFGEKSQFIVSGSDCGHIFIWDKETESIVNFFRGDENGVVNVLEAHPTAPILATSGLDDDIKIWIPSSENAPKMGDLAPTVRKNIRKRKEELERQPDALDGQIMWALWNHLQRASRNRRRGEGAGGANADSDSDTNSVPEEDDDDDIGELGARGVECVIS